jgi:hypothetical protein
VGWEEEVRALWRLLWFRGYLLVSTIVDLLSRNLASRLGLWITTFF